MKLTDFRDVKILNDLRKMMGADYNQNSNGNFLWEKKKIDELKEKLKTKGIDVNIDEIVFENNGLINYKGEIVLIYIRDQFVSYIESGREYKYHTSYCETLEKMSNRNRFFRYVASTRTDGKFIVNFYARDYRGEPELYNENALVGMNVCKNCLRKLNYKGYNNVNNNKRNSIYRNFSLGEFFRIYGGTLHERKPLYTNENAERLF